MWSVVRDGTMPWRPRYAVTMSAGMPGLVELAVRLHARADDADLDRVEHAPAVRQAFEPVPALAGMQDPAVRIGREQLLGRLVERDACRSSDRALPRRSTARRTSPSSARTPAGAADREPASDRLVDRLLGERLPPGPSIIAAATSFDAMSA